LLTDGLTLDEDECRALALRARQAGIGLSTVGLGAEFNEELLITLAETNGGHAYFARSPHQVPGIFDQELKRVEARCGVWS
jgi:Ca-activated chloride channel family protein